MDDGDDDTDDDHDDDTDDDHDDDTHGDNDHSSVNNLSGPLSFPNFMNIEDCNWHDFIISWDANLQIFNVEYLSLIHISEPTRPY